MQNKDKNLSFTINSDFQNQFNHVYFAKRLGRVPKKRKVPPIINDYIFSNMYPHGNPLFKLLGGVLTIVRLFFLLKFWRTEKHGDVLYLGCFEENTERLLGKGTKFDFRGAIFLPHWKFLVPATDPKKLFRYTDLYFGNALIYKICNVILASAAETRKPKFVVSENYLNNHHNGAIIVAMKKNGILFYAREHNFPLLHAKSNPYEGTKNTYDGFIGTFDKKYYDTFLPKNVKYVRIECDCWNEIFTRYDPKSDFALVIMPAKTQLFIWAKFAIQRFETNTKKIEKYLADNGITKTIIRTHPVDLYRFKEMRQTDTGEMYSKLIFLYQGQLLLGAKQYNIPHALVLKEYSEWTPIESYFDSTEILQYETE